MEWIQNFQTAKSCQDMSSASSLPTASLSCSPALAGIIPISMPECGEASANAQMYFQIIFWDMVTPPPPDKLEPPSPVQRGWMNSSRGHQKVRALMCLRKIFQAWGNITNKDAEE